MQGSAWSPSENTAIVQSYLRMLLLEWEGMSYNKSLERRALLALLSNRSESSIEMKHRNISAILLAYGVPPIYGYKPLPNVQGSLEAAVLEGLASIPTIGDLAAKSLTAISENSEIPTLEQAEIPLIGIPWKDTRSRRKVVPQDLIAAEAQAHDVDALALRAVALHEQRSLTTSGRRELAAAVAVKEFDDRTGRGLVLSYSRSGKVKTISVKATNSVAEFPFKVSSDEVDLSLDLSAGFQLYRVFGLRFRPGFYTLKGSLKATAQLTASDYTVLPRS